MTGPGEFFDVGRLASELVQFCDNSDAMAWAQEVTTRNQNTADYVNLGVNLERERIYGKLGANARDQTEGISLLAYRCLVYLDLMAKFGQEAGGMSWHDSAIVQSHADKLSVRQASEELIEQLRPRFTPCEMRDHAPCPGLYRVYHWSGERWRSAATSVIDSGDVWMQASQPMRRYFGPLPDGSDIPAPEPIPE